MKSATTFLRQQLKAKGKTEHTGRGTYIMGSAESLSFDEITKRVEAKADKWIANGLVDSVERGSNADGTRVLTINFNEEVFNAYRTFVTYDSGCQDLLGAVHYSSPSNMQKYVDNLIKR